jgi:hypothetical protein
MALAPDFFVDCIAGTCGTGLIFFIAVNEVWEGNEDSVRRGTSE